MRLVRYSHKDKVGYAVLEADQVKVLDGHPVGELHYTGEVLAMQDIRLLAPIIPSKIVCIGKNYREHALRWDLSRQLNRYFSSNQPPQ